MKNKTLSAFVVVMVMGGCAVEVQREIKIQDFSQRTFIDKLRGLILTAVCESGNCAFSLFDALGSPIVQRKYEKGHFINLKFLPNNSDYDPLFLQILENPNLTHYQSRHLEIEPLQ